MYDNYKRLHIRSHIDVYIKMDVRKNSLVDNSKWENKSIFMNNA